MTIEQKLGKRALPYQRRDQILDAAVAVAGRIGVYNMTRAKVADEANVSPGLVSRYFDAMWMLRTAVMREAVKQSHVAIVSQGLASGDPIARAAPQELKDLAAAHIAA